MNPFSEAAAASEVPARHTDKPLPAEKDQPLQRQSAEDIEVRESQDFTPLASGAGAERSQSTRMRARGRHRGAPARRPRAGRRRDG